MSGNEVIHDSFTIERRYGSSLDKVWQAFVDPAVKRAWFAEGEGIEILEYGSDFRVGGREHARFNVVDAPVVLGIANETWYFDIREGERIVYAYSMANDGAPFSTSLVTVRFEADDEGGTLLTFVEQMAFFEGADGVALRESGTRSLLDSLARALGEPSLARDETWKV
jgi:uncharacterized protein YndB with AHSA1/START domain